MSVVYSEALVMELNIITLRHFLTSTALSREQTSAKTQHRCIIPWIMWSGMSSRL